MKALIYLSLMAMHCYAFAQEINMDPGQKARLYFTEAERRYNQNDFETALQYIEKAENELGETNGRILALKVKTLYNDGRFQQAQQALAMFINNYADSVTPELRAETESYFLKLERYFEQKAEEEQRKAEIARKKTESLKHYVFVNCTNSYCSRGLVDQTYYESCGNCDGTGLVTKYNYAQAFANGLNGTNHATSYKVTCEICKGRRTMQYTRKITCDVCHGDDRLLKYNGTHSTVV